MARRLPREILRRFLTGSLICAGLAVLPTAGVLTGVGLIIAGVVVYVLVPAVKRPQDACVYERIPAVYGPDLIGFLLVGVFFVLPFWARMGEPYLWEEFGLLVHPSAILTWPMALISMAILWFSAQYAAFWLVIGADGCQIGRLAETRYVPYASITAVRPFRRGLPRWMRWLAPILAMAGRPGPAGAIMLARDTVGIRLVLADGSDIAIPQEAFERPMRRLVAALKKNGIRFEDFAR